MNDEQAKKKARTQLNIMLLVTVLPIVAAYVAFYTGIGVPDDTVNNGHLLTPAKPIAAWLDAAEGEEKPNFEQNKIWRIFLPITSSCNKECDHLLYLTRQVHTRLAQKQDRVERYLVNLGGAQGEAVFEQLQAEHPRLKKLDLDAETWANWLEGSNAPDIYQRPYYLMVDQVGFAMMYYTDAQDGNQLLKDIKRVLRYSPED